MLVRTVFSEVPGLGKLLFKINVNFPFGLRSLKRFVDCIFKIELLFSPEEVKNRFALAHRISV